MGVQELPEAKRARADVHNREIKGIEKMISAATMLTIVDWDPFVHVPSLKLPVRGKPLLTGSASPFMPEFVTAPTLGFPLIVTPTAEASGENYSVVDYAKAVHDLLDLQKMLHKYGAVLLRDLPLKNPTQFNTFVESLGWPCTKIAGGGTERTDIAKSVRTASDEPPTQTIEPHMDMAHNPVNPKRIAFWMFEGLESTPADVGGETILTDMRGVLKQLDEDRIPALFEKHGGVLYTKLLWSEATRKDSFTWQRRFFTQSKEEVDKILNADKSNTWRWEKDDTLAVEVVLPAVHLHPATGERLWYNGVHTNHRSYYEEAEHIDTSQGSPMDTSFADGTAYPEHMIEKVRKAMWENSKAIKLRTGDLLIVDNMIAGHGRMSWTPCVPRKLLLCHFGECD